MAFHVSKAEFDAIVVEALRDLPAAYAQCLEEVAIEVRQRPTKQQLRSVELEDDDLLMGLYHGRPRTNRSVNDGPSLPDIIFIFQEDIELVSDSRADLVREVRITVLHEIGHHFGLDEDDLDEVGFG